MSPTPDPITAGRNPSQAPGDREPQRVRSEALLRGGRRLIIDHAGASYTLLLTRNGKLILTK
jgi:hemin uptake protein HemP